MSTSSCGAPCDLTSVQKQLATIYPCTFCPKRFAVKRALVDHMAREHGEKDDIRCHICNKFFSSKGNLARHVVLHTGQQKYSCTLCGKKFAAKDNFDGHMNKHVGAKPYQCRTCLKCFTYMCQLSKHKHICAGHVENMG